MLMNPVAFAAVKARMRSRRSGSIGSGARRSQAMNAAISTPPRHSAVMTCALPQPTSVVRTRPQASATAPAATSARPPTSSLRCWPRLSGSRVMDRIAAARPIGTLIQKIQCQSRPCTTAPPTSGPPATASPPMAPQIPTIAPRRSGGNAAARIVRLSGVTSAAPRPWTARAPIRALALGASAHAAEASVNSSSPVTYIRRRPSRSPSAAAVMMPAANGSVYAFTVHSSVATLPPRLAWIAGSAVTTTSESSAVIKKATDVSTSAQLRWPRAAGAAAVPVSCIFHTSGEPGSGAGTAPADYPNSPLLRRPDRQIDRPAGKVESRSRPPPGRRRRGARVTYCGP